MEGGFPPPFQHQVEGDLASGGDYFDFNLYIFWQARYFDQAASWEWYLKVLFVHFINIAELFHVAYENSRFFYAVHRGTGSFQNCFYVSQALVSLFFNVFGHFAGFRMDWQLAGGDYQIAKTHPLRVGADGWWSIWGLDYFFHDERFTWVVKARCGF